MKPDEIASAIREHMRKLGRKGGKRAAELMSAAQRSDRGRKGGAASKGKPKTKRAQSGK